MPLLTLILVTLIRPLTEIRAADAYDMCSELLSQFGGYQRKTPDGKSDTLDSLAAWLEVYAIPETDIEATDSSIGIFAIQCSTTTSKSGSGIIDSSLSMVGERRTNVINHI